MAESLVLPVSCRLLGRQAWAMSMGGVGQLRNMTDQTIRLMATVGCRLPVIAEVKELALEFVGDGKDVGFVGLRVMDVSWS